MSEEEVAKAFKQVGAYYAKKGYNSTNLMKFLQGDTTNLSKTEQCNVAKGFYEAILSLPKSTSAGVVRTISQ